jgi:hypothetical protein
MVAGSVPSANEGGFSLPLGGDVASAGENWRELLALCTGTLLEGNLILTAAHCAAQRYQTPRSPLNEARTFFDSLLFDRPASGCPTEEQIRTALEK